MSARHFKDGLRFFLLGCFLLFTHSLIAGQLEVHPFIPEIMVPLVVYLAVSTSLPMPVGIVLAFAFGYLFDSISGLPFGLYTLTHVATYVVARGAGLRLFLRGVVSEMLLCFLVCLLTGSLELAMRALFEYPAPFPASEWNNIVVLLFVSLSTGLVAPIVFFLARHLERWSLRRQEQRRDLV